MNESKFIQIFATEKALFALDENGTVWQYSEYSNQWIAKRTQRMTKD